VLRLQKDVLGQLGLEISGEDRDEIRAQIESASADAAAPAWRRLLFARLARSNTRTVVDAENRDSWVVLHGSRVRVAVLRAALEADDTVEAGAELSTDDDDSYHAAVAVELSDHSSHVEAFARAYARCVGLHADLVSDLALAGWLHDIGKADRRFQIMLRGGSEIDFFKHSETLLAKSGMQPGAKRAQRIARERSKYPRGARHEVQSVAMLTMHIDEVRGRAHDLDLVLHLVGSHHGFCRPFAPVAFDETPVDVELREHKSQEFGEISFARTSSGNELYRLDSPLADRFWGLVEKYDWFGLCWLEAILRLADHRASEEEQAGPV
jgi:CRISPR-associated endonuclease/helicase Cas3